MKFADFQLPSRVLKALEHMKYETPTPVQVKAIPLVLEGKDLLVTAQTGTGKTAAFALPILTRMLSGDKSPALVLALTRELAEQIGKVIQQLLQSAPELKCCTVIGGTSFQNQVQMLRHRPAFVVGTPGRLLDQIDEGNLDLTGFKTLVIDEADRLLDMGFEPQIRSIVKRLPQARQTLLFSATLPADVQKLAGSYMKDPVRVAIGAPTSPVSRIQQTLIQTTGANKNETLLREIDKVAGSLIIFTRTKSRTEKLAKVLREAGHTVARIHGDRSQRQRSDAIESFRTGEARILVATDIAARGIDIPDISYVVNYDLPMCPEDYIHRIGRTARAGKEGHSWAFVTPEEAPAWVRIHKLMYGKAPEGFKPQRAPTPKQGKSKKPFMGKIPAGKSKGKPSWSRRDHR